MVKAFIQHDDIPAWSGHSTFRDGHTEFELKYGTHEKVSMMQAMLAQNGPLLEAQSGVCLIIAAYSPTLKAGLLIHLWRDEELSPEAAELLRRPFEMYEQLGECRVIHMLTTERLNESYLKQMMQAKRLLEEFVPSAEFHQILAAEQDGEIGVSVELDTARGHLTIYDDFAGEEKYETVIDYHNMMS